MELRSLFDISEPQKLWKVIRLFEDAGLLSRYSRGITDKGIWMADPEKAAFHLSPKWQILKERLKKARSYKNVKAAKDFNTLIKKLSAAADPISEKTLKELKAAMLTLCEEMEKVCH